MINNIEIFTACYPTTIIEFIFLSNLQSLICIGAMCGSFIASYTLDRFGRKNTILSTTFFFAVGWILIAAAQNSAMFFIGRLICGAGTGISSLCVSVRVSLKIILHW